MTIADILNDLKDELLDRGGLAVDVKFTRSSDVAELSARSVYLQPGGLKIERTGLRESRKTFFVNLISEEHVDPSTLESVVRARVAEFENLAREFTTNPRIGEAFVLSVKTFSDSAAGYNIAVVEGGASLVLSGVEFEIVED